MDCCGYFKCVGCSGRVHMHRGVQACEYCNGDICPDCLVETDDELAADKYGGVHFCSDACITQERQRRLA